MDWCVYVRMDGCACTYVFYPQQLNFSFQYYRQVNQLIDLELICSTFESGESPSHLLSPLLSSRDPAPVFSFLSVFPVRFYEGVVDLCLDAASKADPQELALHFYKSGKPGVDVQGQHVFIARLVYLVRLTVIQHCIGGGRRARILQEFGIKGKVSYASWPGLWFS